MSLRSRITLIAATAVAVTVVTVSATVFLVVGAQLRHQLDQQLRADAHTVAERPAGWAGGDDHDRDRDIGPMVQLLDSAGRPVRRTDGTALPATSGALAVVHGERESAYETVRVAGEEYRMFTRPAEHGGGAVQVAERTESVEEPLRRIGLVLLAVSVGGIAVAAMSGFVVARTGLAPVHRLTRAVEHVAITNDLQGRIMVEGRDEVSRLAEAFNGMLAALQASRTAQRLLVEDAGHELRTPLTSLRANIELLIRVEEQAGVGPGLPAADRAALLRDLNTQTGELAHLVAELVELARHEDSAEPVEPVLLGDLVDQARQRIGRRWPAVTFETDLAPVPVEGRPSALERMIANLLDNAAKWSPPSAPVRVRLRLAQVGGDGGVPASGPWAELTVADAGPGIDEADLPRVFERFYRAAAARAMPGSGLGLAIVAQTVELHHGTVTAGRSEAGGALFTVRVPAVAPEGGNLSSCS
ncbi:HAMP domain-containing sensor histidine kinase [Plantactinospora sp. B5E13]|uniref:HAMP domain-containing sensor histidine kinase n=1 Tax=Plantactinospora sp. B5E13 TaxID=3153758 RepID=UPI00325F3F7F